jgi:hypothetical protein
MRIRPASESTTVSSIFRGVGMIGHGGDDPMVGIPMAGGGPALHSVSRNGWHCQGPLLGSVNTRGAALRKYPTANKGPLTVPPRRTASSSFRAASASLESFGGRCRARRWYVRNQGAFSSRPLDAPNFPIG